MEKALDKMRRLCSRREYCVADIRSKLQKALEGDEGKVEAALKALIEEKYFVISSESTPSNGEKTVTVRNNPPTSLIYGAVCDLFPMKHITIETRIAAATTVRIY